MAGYIWHFIHGYETYRLLSDKTKAKMPKDALRSFMIGVIVPDLATAQKPSEKGPDLSWCTLASEVRHGPCGTFSACLRKTVRQRRV